VSQLHRTDFRNNLLFNITPTIDSDGVIKYISISYIWVKVASIVRIGLAYKFVPESNIYLKSARLCRKNVLELVSGDKCFSRVSIETLYCLDTNLLLIGRETLLT
ncbi:hypothetical protein PHYSODRAFT_501001, partial [Phytophthora sojae]